MTPANPASDQPTTAYGLAEGIAFAQQAEEASPRLPLVDWLARHPHLASKVADFLAGSRGIQQIMPPQGESGSAIAGFELREEIGRGGMGIVYRAYDPNLKRDVAVKRVRADAMGSEGDWARFQFEAEAAASLDHEYIVRVHAYGEANGSPYLVMPLMEGGSLSERLRLLGPDRCLPSKEAAELIRKIALGVHHAHQRGLLHRDLKPANILFDVNSQPHIADFGLARRLDASHSQSASGSIAGTAAYMAPEQARGEKALTTAADIHALGAILFELLTGAPPFGAGEFMPTLKRVLDEEAPSVRAFRPKVSTDLALICGRCLRKHPEDRYPSAMALADDLTKFLNGEPIGQQGRGLVTRMIRAISNRRETASMITWTSAAASAVSHTVVHLIVMLLVIYRMPDAAFVLFVGNQACWGILLWFTHIRRFDMLSPVERVSLAIQLASLGACLALVPATLVLNHGEVLSLIPYSAVIMGLGTFAHGAIFWGRMYALGAIWILIGALMPLFEPITWPAIYGVVGGFFSLHLGFRLRAFHREGQVTTKAFLQFPQSPAGSG